MQQTAANRIIWEEKGSDGHVSEILNGEKRLIRVVLTSYLERSGKRHGLTITSRGLFNLNMPCTCTVIEPKNTALFGKKFASMDEERLAEMFDGLNAAVKAQCLAREPKTPEESKQSREAIFEELHL